MKITKTHWLIGGGLLLAAGIGVYLYKTSGKDSSKDGEKEPEKKSDDVKSGKVDKAQAEKIAKQISDLRVSMLGKHTTAGAKQNSDKLISLMKQLSDGGWDIKIPNYQLPSKYTIEEKKSNVVASKTPVKRHLQAHEAAHVMQNRNRVVSGGNTQPSRFITSGQGRPKQAGVAVYGKKEVVAQRPHLKWKFPLKFIWTF